MTDVSALSHSDNELRTEANDPLLLSPESAHRLLIGAPWQRYAVLGDSLAQGVGDPSPGYTNSGWADRVTDALRSVNPALSYLNTGRIGVTSTQVIADQLQSVLEFQPDLVHLSCGGNDLFTAGGSPDEVRANLDTLFAALTRNGAQICAFTLADVWDTDRMAPMRQMRDRMSVLNDIIRDLAARYDAVLVDLWDHPLRLRPDLMSEDLIHFTTSGHAVLAAEIIRALGHRIPSNTQATA
ncbi:SGNH/GDSL hydrolase family protein [Nocardia sp. XZ_19_369]|uniref:SGNH/GDSL hydrolase family protein n=1 Tax=Nocardia sp. XZ_19_369 TaxID=2769487 RepID=UPI00189091D9|nr:SGNH/GDSL hydrolase family protein [Nocardia sp. XZ_19_369]